MRERLLADFDLRPREGVGLGVVGGDEVVDRLAQLPGAREAGVGQRLPAQDAEPDLDLVEPGSVRGSEVKMDPRMRF